MIVIRKVIVLTKIELEMAKLQKRWARLLKHKIRVYKLR